jgi:hypothetical protein
MLRVLSEGRQRHPKMISVAHVRPSIESSCVGMSEDMTLLQGTSRISFLAQHQQSSMAGWGEVREREPSDCDTSQASAPLWRERERGARITQSGEKEEGRRHD